jgi:hypothetical protein
MIQARALTTLELQMLDIGAPVIVPCQTLAGDIVEVRIQTGNLDTDPRTGEIHAGGCWQAHGAYIAIMPNGVDYGR